jgi:hypothetical protein
LPYFYFVFKVFYPLKTVNLFQALTGCRHFDLTQISRKF